MTEIFKKRNFLREIALLSCVNRNCAFLTKHNEKCYLKCTTKMAFMVKIIDFTNINEYADTMKKTLFWYPTIFILTATVCLLFLLATALIPQDALRDNAAKSAEYFHEATLFDNVVGDLENSKIDNYADCISTGIAWHFGEGEKYTAVISADYNLRPEENVNDSFYREMQGEEVATENYSRYWHGSAGVIRFLLLFADIEAIRYAVATVGLLLNIVLVITLMRRKQVVLGVAYTLAFLLINGIFALTCLEYAFIFLLMPVATMFLVTNGKMAKKENVQTAFMVIGMLTAFLDFLTAETLTFTVPFVIYYVTVCGSKNQSEAKQVRRRSDWIFLLKSGMAWCAGYAGMFLTKWGLSALVLGKDAFRASADMALERISGDVSLTSISTGEKANLGQRLQGIMQRNLGCLYWSKRDVKAGTIALITLIVILVSFTFWYMARKAKYEYDKAALLGVVALVPYLRFLVLSNHTFIHYFFTYRALLVTVMVLFYLIYESTFLSNLKGEKWRKKNAGKS